MPDPGGRKKKGNPKREEGSPPHTSVGGRQSMLRDFSPSSKLCTNEGRQRENEAYEEKKKFSKEVDYWAAALQLPFSFFF